MCNVNIYILLLVDSFKLFPSKFPEDIMRDLIINGPIQVSFHLYEDFRYYKAMADGKCCKLFYFNIYVNNNNCVIR